MKRYSPEFGGLGIEIAKSVAANIPEEMVKPSLRQLNELPYVNQTERESEPKSDIRQLGDLTLAGSGMIIGGSAVVELVSNVDILNSGLSFGISGGLLGAAITMMDR